jgi:mannitol/fructose-specific phosphotransferase system IIA component (Ntr-type)
VSFIFAPVFFARIGLKVNFVTHFHAPLALTVLVIACMCKLAGGALGARWGGMPQRDAWAVGLAMNSRGAMEIILGMLALDAGIISQRLFVSLVVMAIVTSMISGPGMRLVLRPTRKRRLQDVLSSKLFLRELEADSPREAIHELTTAACAVAGLDAGIMEAAVWKRKEVLSAGVGNGVALPHACIDGLPKTLIVVGISDSGIDFDAPDGKLANVIFLILTPREDSGAQLEIASEIALIFREPHLLERVLRTENFTTFLALMKGDSVETRRHHHL